MIKIKKVKTESRTRDKKRNRLLLTIGKKSYHITEQEGLKILEDLQK